MEHSIFPINFGVTQQTIPPPDGGETAVMVLIVRDVGPVLPGGQALGGDTFKVVFGLDDWAQFQRAVADPEGEAARNAARSKIVLAPNGLANRIRPKQ